MTPDTAAPEPQAPTWEEVLAAVEADLGRTERLLAMPVGAMPVDAVPVDAVPVGVVPVDVAVAPAVGLLPTGLPMHSPDPDLPPLSTMPPVPAHLAGRIQRAREHVAALEAELRAELTVLDALRAEQAAHAVRAARFASATRRSASPATFFDSRV